MLEQSTLKTGFEVAEQFGPIATLGTLFIVWQIIYSFNVKKNAVDPLKNVLEEIRRLRASKSELYDKYNALGIEIERRVTHDWNEKKIMPKLDKILNDMTSLTITTEKLTVIIESHKEVGIKLASSIDHLASSVGQLNNRVTRMESKVS